MNEFTNYRLADEANRHLQKAKFLASATPGLGAALPMPPEFGEATMNTATIAQHEAMVDYLRRLQKLVP